PFKPWLAAIAMRKWIDQLRSLGRRPTEELSEHLSDGEHEPSVTSASVLASLLDELPPAQAQLITLVKLQGYSMEEAARETGLSSDQDSHDRCNLPEGTPHGIGACPRNPHGSLRACRPASDLPAPRGHARPGF